MSDSAHYKFDYIYRPKANNSKKELPEMQAKQELKI